MSKEKKFLNFILEIMLTFSIILLVIAIFFRSIVLDKNTYANILDKNNTYSYIKEVIYEKMDKTLGSSIDNNIKESIISEEDIKKEADSLMDGFILYFETGQNNIQPIDMKIYRDRVENIIDSMLTNFPASPDENAYPKAIHGNNTVSKTNGLQFNNMVIIKEKSKGEQASFSTEKLMTSVEAKDRIKALLKEKGLTEAQARQMMIEKGITNDQAIKMLEGYGITIDDGSVPSQNGSSSNNNSSSSSNGAKSVIEGDNKDTIGNSNDGSNNQYSDNQEGMEQKIENAISGEAASQNVSNADGQSGTSFKSKLQEEVIAAVIADDGKSIDEKLNIIKDKVSDEVINKMNSEIEKLNLNELIKSNKIAYLAKITSVFYKMFWLFVLIPILLILLIAKLNNWKKYSSLKFIGTGFIFAGIFTSLIYLGIYASKFYENINIDKVYFNNVISITVKHLLSDLSIMGVVTLGIGLILFIPVMKKKIKSKVL